MIVRSNITLEQKWSFDIFFPKINLLLILFGWNYCYGNFKMKKGGNLKLFYGIRNKWIQQSEVKMVSLTNL